MEEVGLTVPELFQMFAKELIGAVRTGSDERDIISQWYNRHVFMVGAYTDSFIEYLVNLSDYKITEVLEVLDMIRALDPEEDKEQRAEKKEELQTLYTEYQENQERSTRKIEPFEAAIKSLEEFRGIDL